MKEYSSAKNYCDDLERTPAERSRQRGEVSLVGINSSGAHALHTFKWGFNYYKNGSYSTMPLQKIPYSGRYKWLK